MDESKLRTMISELLREMLEEDALVDETEEREGSEETLSEDDEFLENVLGRR